MNGILTATAILLLAALPFGGCALLPDESAPHTTPPDTTPPDTASSDPLPDGFYHVLGEAAAMEALPVPGPNERILPHPRRYRPPESADEPSFLLVGTTPYVPLALDAPPERSVSPSGREVILLDLDAASGDLLEQLTRSWIGGRGAVVVDGEVVTAHRIRTALEGGLLQISCCAEGALEYLFDRLRRER